MTGEKIPELERVGQTSRNSIGGNQKGKRGKDMKTFKKVLASTLAAAMVVTALPVTPANAAATPKLSTTKAAVYVGGSKTLSVKTPSSWKKVKVKATSNKKSIAKISKVSGKKVTVKAVKKGTAKVTVKVTAKKGKKKVSKTLKATVKVKNPSITLNQSKVTLNVGETTPVKVTKKTPSSITVKYSSEDPAIASVSKGTITAISAGKTNIVVTAKYGSKTVTKKIAVTVKAVKDGLTTALTNQLSATDYPNTVLVSDPAIVNVTYTKGGKPVAGQTLVISKDNTAPGTDAYNHYGFENNTATTDASGVATFVVKNTVRTTVKASDTGEVASVNYRIQLANSSAETGTQTVTGTVNFASISVADVTVAKDKTKLKPGTNFQSDTYDAAIANRDYETNANQSQTNSEFLLSQQVSTAGTDEHSVTINGGYPVITLPGKASDATTTKGTQEINYSSGSYKTYVDDKQIFKLEKDPKKLSYATLNFKDVSLSRYTCIKVAAYNSEENAKKGNFPIPNSTRQFDGEMTQAAFGYQIPIQRASGSGVWVAVELISKGQVQDGKNNGYTATNIDYVYKNAVSANKAGEPYKNGKVTWKQVDTPYTAELKFTSNSDINGAILYDGQNNEALNNAKYDYTYKLPVFPYTGDAIITKTDKNGKVVAYYAAATTDNGMNQNIIDGSFKAYQISADEVKETTGTLTQADGKSVTVNAEKAGRMTLEGVVTINGKEIAEADLAHVYSSVQWNPVPKASTAAKNYVALLGQKIEVVGQLVDKNGNAVSTAGENIDFYVGSSKLSADDVLDTANHKAAYGKATVVAIKNTTDTQGQAKVTLKASDITTLQNVTAKTNGKYDVVLKVVKDETVESADLFWADADLKFVDKVNNPVEVKTSTVDNAVKTDAKGATINPEVGTSWFYGVLTEGTFFNGTTTAAIDIKGVDATVTKSAESVGTMESLGEGTAKATSTKAGKMDIVTKLDATTGTSKATIEKDGYAFAGIGTPSIDKKLTLNVAWGTKGITASYIVPTGTRRVTTAGAFDVFIKVQDNFGNAQAKDVTFSVDNRNVALSATTVGSDADTGIASVKLTPSGVAAGDTVTVTAKVGEETYDQTFRFVAPSDALAVKATKNNDTKEYLTKYDKDTKTITLTFNDDIVTDSVVKEMFTVDFDSTKYAVKSTTVRGNVVVLTLVDAPQTINADTKITVATASSTTVDGVIYTLTSTNGMTFVGNTGIWASNNKAPNTP